jgi:hypothetical protein
MMKTRYLVLFALALACVAPSAAGEPDRIIGQLPIAQDAPQEPRVIPKAWGRLVSVTGEHGLTWFYFEAGDGTIRRAAGSQLQGTLVERGIWVRK